MELKKKRRKKRSKRTRRQKDSEFEDPSLRDHMLADAYNGIVKLREKRVNCWNPLNIDAGLKYLISPEDELNDIVSNYPLNKVPIPFDGRLKSSSRSRSKSKSLRNKGL